MTVSEAASGRQLTTPEPTSRVEFERLFESVKNWGRWGPEDQLGTLNYITPDSIRRAASLVRTGRRASMAIPVNYEAGPDNPRPAILHVTHGHDLQVDTGRLTTAQDFIAIDYHGDCHTHTDALCHIAYDGLVYNGRRAGEAYTSIGATTLDIAARATGVVGRGVLLDIPRLRGVKWLEPGEAVTRAELEAAEAAQGVRLQEGDIFVFRTGHHRRRLELGAWDNNPWAGGKAGLALDAIPWLHERRIAAFLPDGDGETVPSRVEGIPWPIHPLQITAMGMCTADSLQLEEVVAACEAEGRWEFMVVGIPLRLPGASGSPWNPVAIF
jgi:kynurenine formamidase